MLKIKLGAMLLALLISTTTVAGIVMASNYNSSPLEEDHKINALSPELSDFYQEESNSIMKIGDLTLTICIVESGRHLLVVYEMGDQKSTLEFIVQCEETGKYQTSIFIDGKLLSLQTLDSNILEPISIPSPNKISQSTSVEGFSSLSPQYTYIWWDGVKQVTGPSYLIKYHHPDRTYYQIATFADWSRNGYRASHNQMRQDLSGVLAVGGWAAIWGAIGAALGAVHAGPVGAAAGALLGALFGYLFGLGTSAVILDEEGCIWWWFGLEFFNWFIANAWWLVWNPLGWGATIGAFLASGYLRVGSWPFWDARGIGNP